MHGWLWSSQNASRWACRRPAPCWNVDACGTCEALWARTCRFAGRNSGCPQSRGKRGGNRSGTGLPSDPSERDDHLRGKFACRLKFRRVPDPRALAGRIVGPGGEWALAGGWEGQRATGLGSSMCGESVAPPDCRCSLNIITQRMTPSGSSREASKKEAAGQKPDGKHNTSAELVVDVPPSRQTCASPCPPSHLPSRHTLRSSSARAGGSSPKKKRGRTKFRPCGRQTPRGA